MKRYILVMLGLFVFNSSALSQNDLHKIHPENDYVYYLDAAVENETEDDWFKTKTGSFYLPFINVDNEEIKYIYDSESKGIYRNKVKISNDVQLAKFSKETVYDKSKITIEIVIGEQEKVSKTLEFII